MTVEFTLTTAGLDTGPFNLYSNLDGFIIPFEVAVSKASLLAGYTSANVPDYTTVVRILSAGTCSNWIDIILENTTTSTTTGEPTTSSSTSSTSTTIAVIACGAASSYSGGQNYPSSEVINLGADTGPVPLQFNAVSVPDRFIVTWDGGVVIDTGYRGSAIYDFGGTSRGSFNASLTGLTDPITSNVYPDFGTYSDDGYPRVLGIGTGVQIFVKSTASPETATIDVYGPMAGTAWNYTLHCPNTGPTTTTTTTGIITSTTTTTGEPTTSTTSTTICTCEDYDVTITAEDLIDATGNTLNPDLNGVVFITYIDCLGDIQQMQFIDPGVYTNAFCGSILTNPAETYWKNNNELDGTSNAIANGNTCC
jgi:hypothetical protein